MEGSPECTKKNNPMPKNTNGKEIKENGKFDNQHGEVFFSDSVALHKSDPCDLMIKNGSQLEGRQGIANHVEKFNSEKELKETKLISRNTIDDAAKRTSQSNKIVVKETYEDEVMSGTSRSIIADPNSCPEDDDDGNDDDGGGGDDDDDDDDDDDGKMIQVKTTKGNRRKLLSKKQVLSCSINAEITAASNSSGR